MKRVGKAFLIFLVSLSGHGSTRGDLDYFKSGVGEKATVYFTQEDVVFAESIVEDTEKILPFYEHSFRHTLDEKLHLILKSSKNHQVMNAFSTQYPHNLATYYAGGVLDPNYFAARSWVDLLSSHEIAHNFQMNVKDNWVSQTTSNIFGNTPFVLLGILPLFSHPNFFIPQFIVEGNAVLNESLYGNGGRLYNGEHLAITLAYLNADRFTPKNMINKQLEFPYGLKPYVIGGYFQLYLAQQYGLNRVNEFFKMNSHKAFAVLSLDDSFKKSFGKGYQTLFKEFVQQYKYRSRGRKVLKGKVIAQSKFSYLMDRDQSGIYFYTQDESGRPSINRLNVVKRKVKRLYGKWFEGRPIVINNKIYTLSNQNVDYNSEQIALFDREQKMLEKTSGKSIQDIQQGHHLYFDVQKSYSEGALYLDDHFISYAHSSAILDRNNNVYYFKNDGKKRTLYRNRQPLFTYQGFWGYPVDVVGETIYFIAPTEFGSTLYKYVLGKVSRVHEADNIVGAKFINETTFLARSVDDQGYSYQLAKVSEIEQTPYALEIEVEGQSHFSLDGHSKKISLKEDYNSLTEMSYEGLWFSSTFSASGRDGVSSDDAILASVTFSDPMEFNSAFASIYNTQHLQYARLGYYNRRYRLAYGFNASHVFDDSRVRYNPYTDFPIGLGGEFFFDFPFWVSGKSRLTMDGGVYVDYDDVRKNPLLWGINYSYAISYGIAKYPDSLFKVSSFVKYDKGGYRGADSKDLSMIGGAMSVGKTLWRGLYLQLSTKYVASNQGNGIRVDNYSFYDIDRTDFVVPGLDFAYYAKQVGSASLYLAKNFNYGWYHRWIPIGVRREALFVRATSLQLEYEGGAQLISLYPEYGDLYTLWTHESITAIQLGMEFELLLGHLLPVEMNVYYSRNNRRLGDNKLVINVEGSF